MHCKKGRVNIFPICKLYEEGENPSAAVKLLFCDNEVMGSSPGKSLLQKCKGSLRT
jgi:hypothetical protein